MNRVTIGKLAIALCMVFMFAVGCSKCVLASNESLTTYGTSTSLAGRVNLSENVKENISNKEMEVLKVAWANRAAREAFTMEGLSEDYLGSYNGNCISPESNDISIFLDDGWEFKYYEDTYKTYIAALTKNNLSGAYLYVTYNGSHTTDEEVTDCIERDGFYGYSIDVANASSKPDMTWSGLTWGATIEEVEAAYGTEPTDVYECDLYTALNYSLDDNMFISFVIYQQNDYNTSTGLQGVDFNMYY